MYGRVGNLKLAAAGVLLVTTVGCTVDVYSPPPREHVYVEAPAPDADVVITDAPPAPVYEEEPPAPGPDYVWIGGEYVVVDGHYVWHHGYYGHAPHGRHHWIAARYEHRGHGYVRVEGHWE